jgi:hypothetical protein
MINSLQLVENNLPKTHSIITEKVTPPRPESFIIYLVQTIFTMKIQTIIFLFCLISITSIQLTAQWTNIGNNTVFTTRDVGIDTSAPQQKLDVAGAIRIGRDDFGDVDGSIRFNGTNFQGFVLTWKNLDEQPLWSQNGSSDTYFEDWNFIIIYCPGSIRST